VQVPSREIEVTHGCAIGRQEFFSGNLIADPKMLRLAKIRS
jgi:hypothetical protein